MNSNNNFVSDSRFAIAQAANQSINTSAELDVQISTAKAYPRNVESAINEASYFVTLSEEMAALCFYSIPFKKKVKQKDGSFKYEQEFIQGASIRLAEIMATSWGNIHMATRIKGKEGKYIIAEAAAWDLEKNIRISAEIKELIRGDTDDMEKIAGASACAKALRNVIFKIIPGTFQRLLLDKAKECAIGNQKSLPKKRKEVFVRLKALGIDEQVIFDFFNKSSIDDFNITDIANLIGIGTAIKDNLLNIDNAFKLTEENTPLTAKERVEFLLAERDSKKQTELLSNKGI